MCTVAVISDDFDVNFFDNDFDNQISTWNGREISLESAKKYPNFSRQVLLQNAVIIQCMQKPPSGDYDFHAEKTEEGYQLDGDIRVHGGNENFRWELEVRAERKPNGEVEGEGKLSGEF